MANFIRKFSALALTLLVAITLSAQVYTDKQVLKDKIPPPKWSGFLDMNLGYSPSHAYAVLGASAGITHRYVQLSATALQLIQPGDKQYLDIQFGYRWSPQKYFTLIPHTGLHWFTEDPIKGGNDFVYGLTFLSNTEGRIRFKIDGNDVRLSKGSAKKLLIVGLQYVIR